MELSSHKNAHIFKVQCYCAGAAVVGQVYNTLWLCWGFLFSPGPLVWWLFEVQMCDTTQTVRVGVARHSAGCMPAREESTVSVHAKQMNCL